MIPGGLGLALRIGGPLVLAVAVAGGGWWLRAQRVPAELEAVRAEILAREAACEVGSFCAQAALRRAAETAELVAVARQAAEERAAASAAADAARLAAELAGAAERASDGLVKAAAAERRLLEAMAASQECSTWESSRVPCPLE
jgi:hypothetical protein